MDSVYLRDMVSSETVLVSHRENGEINVGAAQMPRISTSGRFVVFESRDSELTGFDDSRLQVFLHDRTYDSTVNVTGAGVVSDATGAAVNADGTYVAFESYDPTAVPNDTNGFENDVFLRDRDPSSSSTVAISRPSATSTGDGYSGGPDISDDGRYVVFLSDADDLVEDGNGHRDIFVFDRVGNDLTAVSLSLPNGAGGGPPAIAPGGAFVAFQTSTGASVDIVVVGVPQ